MRAMMRLLRDTRGQDLAEYAMITALVGLVGIATWALLESRIGQAYVRHDTGTQNLWEPPNPGP
jgi:Flp pilus assembly pilin Flp